MVFTTGIIFIVIAFISALIDLFFASTLEAVIISTTVFGGATILSVAMLLIDKHMKKEEKARAIKLAEEEKAAEALRKMQEELEEKRRAALEKERKAAEEKAKFEKENTIVLNRPYDKALSKARALANSNSLSQRKWGGFLERLLTSRQYLASKQIVLDSSTIEKCVDFWPAIFEGVTVYTDDDGNGVPDEFQNDDDYFEVETPKKK